MSKYSIDCKLDQLKQGTEKINERLGHLEHQIRELQTKEVPQPEMEQIRSWSQRLLDTLIVAPVRKARKSGPLGFLIGVLSFASVYSSLRYDITVAPYATFSEPKPLDAHFLVTNDGPFSIYNVFYSCTYFRVESGHIAPVRFATLSPSPQVELSPKGGFTIRCTSTQTPDTAQDKGWIVAVQVFYTPKFLPRGQKSGGQMFLFTSKQPSQTAWLPMGYLPKSNSEIHSLYITP